MEGCYKGCDAPGTHDGLCEDCYTHKRIEIRIPPELFESVKTIAKKEFRTIEGQILAFLQLDVDGYIRNQELIRD